LLFNFFAAISTPYPLARRRAATNDRRAHDTAMRRTLNRSTHYREFARVLTNFTSNTIGSSFALRRII
jgi:hypothetical protein